MSRRNLAQGVASRPGSSASRSPSLLRRPPRCRILLRRGRQRLAPRLRLERIVIQLAYRHAAVRPSVELLTLRASDRRPPRHAAVGLSIELLALRASDRRSRRHAAVRPSVELVALRASDG